MCRYIEPGMRVLEVGCGNGDGGRELARWVGRIRYVGLDISVFAWRGEGRFVAGDAERLPLRSGAVDAVVAMFVMEHLVFPADFLDEAWRVLRGDGRLLLVSPDFATNAMASEDLGFTYGPGREKLKAGKWLDALLTGFDSRVRIPRLRRKWRRELERRGPTFRVLLEPRCLRLPGFVPDCDAVYPVAPEEVLAYLRTRPSFGKAETFYRDGHSFGLVAWKASA